MKLFSSAPEDQRFDALMGELQELKTAVTELKGEREGLRKTRDLETEISKLTRELTDKQIKYDREKEKWDRDKRETEHLVGLQRKRSEFETDAAKREATLNVREENLKAQQERFDEHVVFIEKRFDQQFESLNGLMEKFLERMPTTKQLISVGRNGNEDEN